MRGRGRDPDGSWQFEGWRGFRSRAGFGGEGAERLERGILRFLVLEVLQEGPRHGYEIIKALEERTHGRYSPSPGTIYPTLQHLSDLGLIASDQEGDRRVYRLTEAGRAEWEQRAEQVKGFWARFGGGSSPESQAELSFVADELHELARTVRHGIRPAADRGDRETVRRVRSALERCKNEIRSIIAASAEGPREQAGIGGAREESL